MRWASLRLSLLLACSSFLWVHCGGGGGSTDTGGGGGPSPGNGSQISGVLTWHNDNARTGANTNETILTPANVNSNQFGKLFSYSVDGEVYAQPLVALNVDMPGGRRNVLIVATEHDSVYAFDADSNQPPFWKTSFIDPARGITTFPVGSEIDYACCFDPEIGITGTPVIDPSTGTIYVVAETRENGTSIERLHALDIRTGQERPGSPVRIQASVPGNTADAVNGQIAFRPELANQRPGLLLSRGMVYIAWGSNNDRTPYHGWVMAYRADNLQQVGVFNATPEGQTSGDIPANGGGGIWMSGAGPSADSAGNVYATVGNGAFNANNGGRSFSNSFIKFGASSGALNVADFFAPHDVLELNKGDLDLGTGAPLLFDQSGASVPHLLVTAGKNGTIYLLNRDSMGRHRATDNSHAVQAIEGAINDFPRCSAAYWNNTIYLGSLNDTLKAFRLNNALLPSSATSRTSHVFPFPGPTPSISASGTNNGIVWALHHSGGPAVLRAFAADDLSRQLYSSSEAGSRDTGPPSIRFAVPTIVNGKVYIGGRRQVTVYGLR